MSDTSYLEKPSSVVSSFRIHSKWNGMEPAKFVLKNKFIIDERKSTFQHESSNSTLENGKFQKTFIKRYWNEALIKSFLDLSYNWNGNGAVAIDKAVVLRAISLLRVLDHQPDIFPTARNTIQFEYEYGDDYLEIEIFDGYFNVYRCVDNGETEYRTTAFQRVREEVLNYHASIRNK